MTVHAAQPSTDTSEPFARRWYGLVVLCLSLLIVVMANTSLIVAAPDLIDSLSLTSGQLQWVIDAYTVPYAALMLVMGLIGDRFGRRKMLIAGLGLFAVGAIIGTLVDSVTGVMLARVIMGVAAAMVMPATLSLLVAMFPRRERATAITVWTATSGLAIAMGPLLAGALLQNNGWSSTFLINVPIVVIAIPAALLLVPASKAPGQSGIDLVGGLLSIIGLAGLIYMIIEGPHNGWEADAIVAGVIGAVAIAAFIAWELRHPSPALDIRMFRNLEFSGANLAVLLFFFAAFGAIYFISQHLQFVLDFDPLQTGIRLLPLAGAVFIGAGLTNALTPRLGARVTITAGMLLAVASLALMLRVDGESTYAAFAAPLALLGVAIGLSVAPATDVIMGNFPEQRLGIGGGVNDTSIELGGSLGIAVLGSILSSAYRNNATDIADTPLPPEAAEAATESIGGAHMVNQGLQGAGMAEPADQLGALTADAYSSALAHTSGIAAAVVAGGAVVVAVLMSIRQSDRSSTTPPDTAQKTTVQKETAQ